MRRLLPCGGGRGALCRTEREEYVQARRRNRKRNGGKPAKFKEKKKKSKKTGTNRGLRQQERSRPWRTQVPKKREKIEKLKGYSSQENKLGLGPKKQGKLGSRSRMRPSPRAGRMGGAYCLEGGLRPSKTLLNVSCASRSPGSEKITRRGPRERKAGGRVESDHEKHKPGGEEGKKG